MATPVEQEYAEKRKQEKERKWFDQRVMAYAAQKFWGKVTLSFENGRIRKITEEKSLIPPVEEG